MLRAGSAFGRRPLSTVPRVPSLLDGKLFDSAGTTTFPITCPATGAVVAQTPQSTTSELEAAAASCARAFPAWRATAPAARARVNLKLQALVREATEPLAASITAEQGKTLADARGDVFRGLECVRAREARGRRAAAAAAPTPAPPSLPLACAQGGRVCGVGAVAADGRDGGQHLGGH